MVDEYSENVPVVFYGHGEYCRSYYRICPKCGRFVSPDMRVKIPEYQGNEPNATCKKCGRVRMQFCTWVEDTEDG